MTPSPPPDASGTARGLMGLVAQTFAGIKTFTSAIVASAGIQVASLFNTNGTGASDVGVKVGVSTADASVNATAHILSARTGISGAEVEKFWVNKLGPAVPINGQFSLNGDGGGIFLTYRSADGMAGFSNGAAAYLGIFPGTGASGCSGGFTAGGGFVGPTLAAPSATTLSLRSPLGAGASDVVAIVGSTAADASVNSTAKLLSARTGIGGTELEKFSVEKLGSIRSANGVFYGAAAGSNRHFTVDDTSFFRFYDNGHQFTFSSAGVTHVGAGAVAKWSLTNEGFESRNGADQSATIGAATSNKPSGINTIASGATSIVITNSLVPNPATTKVRLNLNWRGDPGGRWWWTQGTGTITITLSAAAPANTSFDWELAGLL